MVSVKGKTFLNKNSFGFFEILVISLIIKNTQITELAFKS